MKTAFHRTMDGAAGARLVIVAQLMVVAALLLGLQFVVRTTGGTLFLAASIAPVLAIGAAILVAGVLIYRYRKQHSLFAMEVFEPGEVIFSQGDLSDCAYFIQSGEVEVLHRENGRETILATLKDGEYFGEMALLSNAPRNATVRARSTTVVGLMGKENFLSMLSVIRSTHDEVRKTVEQRSADRGRHS
jgi:hypothetical protein